MQRVSARVARTARLIGRAAVWLIWGFAVTTWPLSAWIMTIDLLYRLARVVNHAGDPGFYVRSELLLHAVGWVSLAVLVVWWQIKIGGTDAPRRREAPRGPRVEREAPRRTAASPRPRAARDPWEVLGVPRDASAGAIREAYFRRMKEYHPDRCAHLGEELRVFAEQKAKEINRAYELLRARAPL